MRSVTKNMASRVGMKGLIHGSCMAANGTRAPHVMSMTAATANANRRCPDVGGMVANENVGSSNTSSTADTVPYRRPADTLADLGQGALPVKCTAKSAFAGKADIEVKGHYFRF